MIVETQSGEFDTVLKTKWGTFELMNPDKVTRVIDGETNDKGEIVGGLGADADTVDILKLYDKKGGLIRGKEGSKVKTGSFFDFVGEKRGKPRKEPEVAYVFTINGKQVEYAEGADKPLELRAAELVAQAEAQSRKEDEGRIKKALKK